MRKSWVFGAALVAAVHAAWWALIYFESRADWFMAAIIILMFVTMNVAGLGAFITGFTAPRRGFWLGLSMAPLAAVLATISNLLLQASGTRVDFSGFHNDAGLFAVSLAYGLFVAAIGAGIGLWMRRRKRVEAGAMASPQPAAAGPSPAPDDVVPPTEPPN
jgi:hypothetical protein